MGKVVDGVELLRMIRDGEIKQNDEIRFSGKIYRFDIEEQDFFEKGKSTYLKHSIFQNWTIDNMLSFKFEILSEENGEIDIDIDSIEELNDTDYENVNIDKLGDYHDLIVKTLNEVIKAVKQLNKKLEGK